MPHLPSFEVEGDVITQPDHPKNGNKRFYIKASFLSDDPNARNIAAFHCETSNLETAFEMVETFAQHVRGMNREQFQMYLNSVQSQRLFFNINDKNTDDAGQHYDAVRTYQYNRLGTGLENAFSQPTHTLTRRILDDLNRYAGIHKNAPGHPHPHNAHNQMRVRLN